MKVIISEYDPHWAAKFQDEKKVIAALIGNWVMDIQHIGSTSVPGLVAKPMIDILVGVQHGNLDGIIEPMRSKYTYIRKYENSWPARRLFCRLQSDTNSVLPDNITASDPNPADVGLKSLTNIHCVAYDSTDWIRHIAFRDYLIAFPQVKTEYAQLKKELSAREFKDMFDYNDAKNDFIKRAKLIAIKWYSESFLNNNILLSKPMTEFRCK